MVTKQHKKQNQVNHSKRRNLGVKNATLILHISIQPEEPESLQCIQLQFRINNFSRDILPNLR